MKKKYLIPLIILIFVISVAVRYWPIYHKGFSNSVSTDSLILARNLSLTGEYKIDSEKNVILSSELIGERGTISAIGNKLTPILYSLVFRLVGFNQNIPVWVSLILYGISSVLLFILVKKIFNFWVALIFSLIEIFSPLVAQSSIQFGVYEWAVFFSTIAVFIYLYKEKTGYPRLIFTGLFFGLASLSRNSFLIIPLVFLVYEFYKNKSFKRAILIILPVVVLWGIFLIPSVIENGKTNNAYLEPQKTTRDYLHIFPDPYTWHFERDAFVGEVEGTTNYTYSEILNYYGYPISFKDKVLMYWASIVSYPKGLFAQTIIGGPFLVFFLILGGIYLYKNKKDLLKLFVLWSGFLYLLLVINKSNHWGHFMILQLPLFLLISLGIYWINQFIFKQNFRNYFKYFLISGFIFVLFLQLIQSDKWVFHEGYLYSKTETAMELVKIIEMRKDIIDKKVDIIAVGSPNSNAPGIINWFTDFSCVYFDPGTVKELLEKDRLQWAFDQFGVNRIIGYDQDLTEEIIKATNAEII